MKKIRVSEERMPVVIGKKGMTRKGIERKTGTKISIGDEVTISGEALDVMTAENVVKAIARGFSPKNAFDLLEEDVLLAIIDLPKDEKSLKRLRSRLIGTRGKSRRNLELLTKTKISIYGRTVGIIGKYENLELASDAVNRIIKGFSHRNVYSYLEHHQNEIRNEQ